MRAPRSFTGEDVVEIGTHGGMVASRMVLKSLIKNGAYPAGPGEFTKRAFLNGKIDLSEAEGVIDIINAKNETAEKNAVIKMQQKATANWLLGIAFSTPIRKALPVTVDSTKATKKSQLPCCQLKSNKLTVRALYNKE